MAPVPTLEGVMFRRFALLVLVLVMLMACGVVCSAAGAAGIVWSGPFAIDRQVPFANPDGLGPVSCARSSLCVAIDARGRSGSLEADTIVSSTDPAGGPAAWRETSFAGRSDIDDLVCASARMCVGINNPGAPCDVKSDGRSESVAPVLYSIDAYARASRLREPPSLCGDGR